MEVLLYIVIFAFVFVWIMLLLNIRKHTVPGRRWHKRNGHWKITKRPKKKKYTQEHLLCCGAPPEHRGECYDSPRML